MSSYEELPTEFDVVVLGTGLPESILAAACSRVGLTVLHLDRNDYYGAEWASFNLDGLHNWISSCGNSATQVDNFTPGIDEASIVVGEGEKLIPLPTSSKCVSNIVETWHIGDDDNLSKSPKTDANLVNDVVSPDHVIEAIGDKSQSAGSDVLNNASIVVSTPMEEKVYVSKAVIEKEWRKFNLDLSPKLLFGRGPLVNLLITSNVGRYAEFKIVNRLLVKMDEKLQEVPCSRADVFQTKQLALKEKRILMSFLQYCLNYEQDHTLGENGTMPFHEFLARRQLSQMLQNYVINSLAMVKPNTNTLTGLKATKKFLMSVGRYGNSPFLFPLYGCGELPQCFCRLCAVYGGTYYLRRNIDAIVLNQAANRVTAVVTGGQKIGLRTLIMEPSYVPLNSSVFHDALQLKNTSTVDVSRAILLTDRSVMDGSKNPLSLISLVDVPSMYPIRILELGSDTCVCPKNTFVVYLWTQATCDATKDLKMAIESLFPQVDDTNSSCTPKILWSLFYNQKMFNNDLTTADRVLSNVVVTKPPDFELDYENTVNYVRKTFQTMWPDEEFLPMAPNPEEVAFEDENNELGINGFTPQAANSAEGGSTVENELEKPLLVSEEHGAGSIEPSNLSAGDSVLSRSDSESKSPNDHNAFL